MYSVKRGRITLLSLNELGEKSRATIILGKFCKQAIIKLSLAYSFRKMFFIGQNLKHVHMTYSFLELLIFFCLKKYCASIQTSWETNHKIPIMNLFLILMLKKPVFYAKLRLLVINFNVSQFHEHIFRSSRSQIFFKIGAVKNFATLKIKNGLQHKCFPVRSSHVMLTY